MYEATLQVAAPFDGTAVQLPDPGASDNDRYDAARRTLKDVVEQLDALAAGVLEVLSPPDAASIA